MGKVSSDQLYDLSFAGSVIRIDGVGEINHFMDDANPVEFPDVTVANVGVNLNGIMARHSNPAPVIFSVTVIPGSVSDYKLYALWEAARIKDGKYKTEWGKGLTADIMLGRPTNGNSHFHFEGGTMLSGPGGPAASGEGKMLGRTYTLGFASAHR